MHADKERTYRNDWPADTLRLRMKALQTKWNIKPTGQMTDDRSVELTTAGIMAYHRVEEALEVLCRDYTGLPPEDEVTFIALGILSLGMTITGEIRRRVVLVNAIFERKGKEATLMIALKVMAR
jgi:hypothetical protein